MEDLGRKLFMELFIRIKNKKNKEDKPKYVTITSDFPECSKLPENTQKTKLNKEEIVSLLKNIPGKLKSNFNYYYPQIKEFLLKVWKCFINVLHYTIDFCKYHDGIVMVLISLLLIFTVHCYTTEITKPEIQEEKEEEIIKDSIPKATYDGTSITISPDKFEELDSKMLSYINFSTDFEYHKCWAVTSPVTYYVTLDHSKKLQMDDLVYQCKKIIGKMKQTWGSLEIPELDYRIIVLDKDNPETIVYGLGVNYE